MRGITRQPHHAPKGVLRISGARHSGSLQFESRDWASVHSNSDASEIYVRHLRPEHYHDTGLVYIEIVLGPDDTVRVSLADRQVGQDGGPIPVAVGRDRLPIRTAHGTLPRLAVPLDSIF
jgi:hypothetical protein